MSRPATGRAAPERESHPIPGGTAPFPWFRLLPRGGLPRSYARDLRPLAAVPLDAILASAPQAAARNPPLRHPAMTENLQSAAARGPKVGEPRTESPSEAARR